jgi:hypothetical protein
VVETARKITGHQSWHNSESASGDPAFVAASDKIRRELVVATPAAHDIIDVLGAFGHGHTPMATASYRANDG